MNKNNLFSHLYIIIGLTLLTVIIIFGQYLSLYRYKFTSIRGHTPWSIYPKYVWIPPITLIFLGFRERFYSKNK
ncbi:hypothetical protein [Paramaledivibacter caminithermalis]|uniref:Uncharacterized protein n=1 Tax=Paramaledivibacter caminithermalis (strain DSM 15212 / CIP 107654 / DViRD3) TaxID=1121301 RepID=A0A1M6M9G5_PARC5|nr:hypothetical protein [Paramaledivibacter caminithermalis]SHJ80084.1 hypothetical protein SAMN02745912_01148 [Paramaledivibacter caminithermalis DSM 15212]